jgi:hypothetical protein
MLIRNSSYRAAVTLFSSVTRAATSSFSILYPRECREPAVHAIDPKLSNI